MHKKTKLKIIFGLSLATGIGLTIGGIFLPPLIAPGVAFIAGSLSMFQSTFSNVPCGTSPVTPDVTSDSENTNTTAVETASELSSNNSELESERTSVATEGAASVTNNYFFLYNRGAPAENVRNHRRRDRLELV